MPEKINATKLTKKILIAKKRQTGHSMAKLVEYAVINMPFIDPKKIKNEK